MLDRSLHVTAAAAFLAIFCLAPPAEAALTASDAEVLEGSLPPDPSPACGLQDARLRLRSDYTQGPAGEQLCRYFLENVAPGGEVIESTELLAATHCGGVGLVCDETGAGVALIADQYDATIWVLQRFDPSGIPLGGPATMSADSRCDMPDAWYLAAGGDVLALDNCGPDEWPLGDASRSVALRRFPAEGGVEPEPTWVAGPAAIGWLTMGNDEAGNTLVAWEDTFEHAVVDSQYVHGSRILVRAVLADGSLSDEVLHLNQFEPERVAPYRVVAEAEGVFAVHWYNHMQGGYVTRSVSLDPELYPLGPVTTTTLPPSPDAPAFERIRTVGQDRPDPAASLAWEGTLASMVSDGSGGLLLRRWVQESPAGGNYSGDEEVPTTSAWSSNDGGVRFRRVIEAPPVYRYQDTPPWDAASTNGTMLAAEVASQIFWDEEEGYSYAALQFLARRSDDHGRTWSEPSVVADRLCFDCDEYFFHEATFASDGKGTWMAAWVRSHEINGGSIETWATTVEIAWSHDDGRTWTSRTNVWSAESLIYAWSEDDQTRHRIFAGAGANGSWGIVWRSERQGAMWVARTDGSASPWETTLLQPPFEKPPEIDPGDWYDPAVPYARPAFVVTPAAWIIAWEEEHAPDGDAGDIYFVRSVDHGRSWSPAAPLHTSAGNGARDFDVSVAAGADGEVLAAWATHDSFGGVLGHDADIVTAWSGDDGLTWSPPAAIDPDAAADQRRDTTPIASSSGEGRWTVAWSTTPLESRWVWDQKDASVKVAMSGSTCGDGITDAGEECDDGNDEDGDGCNTNCSDAGCGNEVSEPGESCEIDDPEAGFRCSSACSPTICGDGELNPWIEQCDDGNGDDSDRCPANCRRPRCGDGFVFEELETCDDGNTIDGDGCHSSCKREYCGDGFVNEPVELCDDWDGWGGNSCTDECLPAVCGDGRVWVGVEQCDDPDGSVHHGNCSSDCRLVEPCSDADSSGTTTATDALLILRTAVAIAETCVPDRCDVNGSGTLTAVDASSALRTAAGFEVPLECPTAGFATFVLEESVRLGALQVVIDFAESGFGFGLGDGKSHCEVRVPGAMSMTAIRDGSLILALISLDGFQGPLELFRCPIYASRGAPGGNSGAVAIGIADAADTDGNPVSPPPQVRLVTD